MRKKLSLKDLAERMGVSTAVVSMVLNEKYQGRVNEAKATEIKKLAEALNYAPNQIAKSLKRSKTFTIGLIIADISNLFYSSIARVIEDESEKHRYNVIFGSADENARKFEKLVRVLVSRQVDGIILAAPAGAENVLNYLNEQQIPFVLVDRYFPALTDINSVTIDNYQASYAVVEMLAHNGYKKPAMVTLSTQLFHMKERTRGFHEACVELLDINKPCVLEIQEDQLESEIESRMLTLIKNQVDLVYFSTNKIAMAGLAVLVKHGISVPMEIGVVCFDEAASYKIFNTSITYVQQPMHQIGKEAVDMLLSLLEGDRFAKNIVLGTRIEQGNSSAARTDINKY